LNTFYFDYVQIHYCNVSRLRYAEKNNPHFVQVSTVIVSVVQVTSKL